MRLLVPRLVLLERAGTFVVRQPIQRERLALLRTRVLELADRAADGKGVLAKIAKDVGVPLASGDRLQPVGHWDDERRG